MSTLSNNLEQTGSRPIAGQDVQKGPFLTLPTLARQDSPFHGQGRALPAISRWASPLFGVGSVQGVREHDKGLGTQAGLPAIALAKAGGIFQHPAKS